jgi:hypothetical protein
MGTNAELYKQDFFEWTQTTAALIRVGKRYDIAPEAPAEEVESLGARDHRELRRWLQRLVTQSSTASESAPRCALRQSSTSPTSRSG